MIKAAIVVSRDCSLFLSVNCVSLAAVASSVEGPERSKLFTDNHHQWGHSG